MSQSVIVMAPGGSAVVTAGGGASVARVPTTVVVQREAAPKSVVVTRGVPGRQGPRGPAGPAGGAVLVRTGMPLSGHSLVAQDAAGALVYADCTAALEAGAALGIVTDAYLAGEDAVVQTGFDVEHAGWAWAPGPVLLGAAGRPVQSLPPGAVFSQVIGWAVSPTRLRIDVQPPFILS